MGKSDLSEKQLAVIDGLVAGELDEQAILEKYEVGRQTFNDWLSDKAFSDELDRRIEWFTRRSELQLARNRSTAVNNLVKLTKTENGETARKACLDIITMPSIAAKQPDQAGPCQTDSTQTQPTLSQKTASKLLAVLAEET
ncbi:MAG: hypothetical protein ACYSTF_04285 [Planctomycetota bacterium]|jgi:hypothetical protein